MLTRDDRTVPDAEAHLDAALDAGLTHIGFKDVGRPVAALQALQARIRAAGAVSALEVVSDSPEAELASLRAGAALGVDWLLGGVQVDAAREILAGTGIRYMPFPGRVHGSPSVLAGTEAEIVASAAALAAAPWVSGLDLLAWRFAGDAPGLLGRVCAAAWGKPVVAAGSIDRPSRVAAARAAGAAGFTVGTALLDDAFEGLRGPLPDRLRAVAALARA